jgi:choline monooxygenase
MSRPSEPAPFADDARVWLERAVDARGGGCMLPSEAYTSDAILDWEREHFFARGWVCAGRVLDLAHPGQRRAVAIGDDSIVCVRGDDGVLRAFFNVCRHRGHELLPCGATATRAAIHCPYHGWTYALDGSLRAAPRSDREPGFDPEALSLVPASAGVWGPFLFANPDPDAEPLEDWLGELPAILARDLDLDAVTFHSRVEFGSNANWKVVTENFLECYHCPTAHPGFSAVVDVHPDRYVLEPHATFSSQHCETRGGRERGQFHLLYPNTGINVFPGTPNLSIGPIVPAAPARTERYLDYFFEPGVDEGWLREFFAFDDQVGREDTALVESVQRGMAAGLLAEGRLLLNAEPLIAAFQGWVAERLAG